MLVLKTGLTSGADMKLKLSSLLLLTVSSLCWADVAPRVIYGDDNRVDTYQSPSSLFKQLAASTAAHVPRHNIKIVGNNAELRGPSLGEVYKLCKKERFYHQPMIANCSGFLVAPDIIATAGHCFDSRQQCTQFDWVFNYKVETKNQTNVTVNASDVYRCKEVIKQSLSATTDFALIRLDREVVGVSPLEISKTPAKVGTSLVMIGHPSGLPQKITDDAVVKSVSATEFKANLDAFQINSGSAVLNAQTGELLGILVRGHMDYRTNEGLGCTEVNSAKEDTVGEDVASFTQFIDYLK
jgi:hypothetical protein